MSHNPNGHPHPMRIVLLIGLLLTSSLAYAHGPVPPSSLFAPQDTPEVEDCPVYKGNRFEWKHTCGGVRGLACHTHMCVNKFCWEPKQCVAPYSAIGVAVNGDAICAIIVEPTPVATPCICSRLCKTNPAACSTPTSTP